MNDLAGHTGLNTACLGLIYLVYILDSDLSLVISFLFVFIFARRAAYATPRSCPADNLLDLETSELMRVARA